VFDPPVATWIAAPDQCESLFDPVESGLVLGEETPIQSPSLVRATDIRRSIRSMRLARFVGALGMSARVRSA
jgi:hypothetical protein